MEIDANRLQLAIEYMKRMAEGNNPVTNRPAENDSVINDVNVVRCLHYVEEVLKFVRDDKKMKGKKKEITSFEILNQFSYKKDLPISKLFAQINELTVETGTKKLSYKKIIEGLLKEGYLEEVYCKEMDKNIKIPTQKGLDIGIYTERREGANGGIYYVTLYEEKAQRYIVENIERYYSL